MIQNEFQHSYSEKPYIPFGWEKTGIYVVRLAPSVNGVEAQWISESEHFTVCVFEGDKQVKSVQTSEKKIKIDGLTENVTYTLEVESGEKKSRKRLFTTGDYRGQVINYLHTDDLQYEYSGRYLASPYIVSFHGDLYVSMDCFRGGDQRGGFNLTLLFRSKDNGNSWEYVCDIVPAFWASLFVANDKLYLLSVSTEFGDLLISESTDGENWSEPTKLLSGNGCGYSVGVHKGTTTVWELDGKMYIGIEYGGYPVKNFYPFIAVLDLSKNPLDKKAWTFSDVCEVQPEWGGDPAYRLAIEGNAVAKDGEIYDLLRFNAGKALMLKYDKNTPKKAPVYHKTIDFPIGHCKFFIQQSADGTYYAMGNHTCYPRHIVQLFKSKDLENWEFVKTLEDVSDLSVEKDGVQYPTFIIQGKKLITVLRVGLHGAHSFHDSNAAVFRIFDID